MNDIHLTIGIYNNGSYVTNGVKTENLKDHIWYNQKFRFGRALIVDGIVVHNGYLTEERLAKFIKEELPKIHMPYRIWLFYPYV